MAPVEEPNETAEVGIDDQTVEAEAAPDDTSTHALVDDGERPTLAREPSASAQSKQRSESFRQGSTLPTVGTDLKASASATSPQSEVQELYRKQAARIEELEQESKASKDRQEEAAARLEKAEEELEGLREGSGDVAELRSKAKDAERLETELAAVRRELAQTQQAAKSTNRRVSNTGPDMSQELASKTSAIESLELELSNVRNQFQSMQSTVATRDTLLKDLEDRTIAAETATESYKQELEQLKLSIAFPSDETKAANEDPEALTKRISILESDLRTAHTTLDAAAQRATNLEHKIEALTKLHRDAAAANASKDKELTDLRERLRKRDRPSHVRDASDFELGDEETETGALQARIRALEAETFDLRRGVWREKRAELQPGMDASPEYEDVDLNNGPYGAAAAARDRGSVPRQSSTFQDVLTSGISAFTGRSPAQREPGHASGARKMSVGLLSDDGGFDEDAFAQAQEEEARRRVERVKEVKRGLERWKAVSYTHLTLPTKRIV